MTWCQAKQKQNIFKMQGWIDKNHNLNYLIKTKIRV